MSGFHVVDAEDGDNVSEDSQHDQYDRSAYDILEFAQAGYPCLTFDFLRGPSFESNQPGDNYRMFLLAGSQADNGNNSLTLMYLSNIRKIQHKKSKQDGGNNSSDTDDELDDNRSEQNDDTDKSPVFEHASFRHQGVCNRIKCTDLSNCSGPAPDGGVKGTHFAASWSELGNVYIWNLQQPLEAVQDAQTMSRYVRSRGRQSYATFVHDSHSVEGFALDWSPINKGHLLTGDGVGLIKLLQLGSKSNWQEVNLDYKWHKGSVEDIQWSPCEATVFASASTDHCIAIWDTRIGKRCQLCINNAHRSDVNVISWNSKDTTLLASGGDDGIIKVWDLRLLSSCSGIASSNNNGSGMCSSIDDDGVCIVQNGKMDTCAALVASFSYHKKPITSIEWNPNDSSVLAASSEDGEITLWDLAVEKVIPSESLPTENQGELSSDKDLPVIPAQMMFNHGGLVDIKEVHWHRGISGLVGSTSASGFCFFKSISI